MRLFKVSYNAVRAKRALQNCCKSSYRNKLLAEIILSCLCFRLVSFVELPLPTDKTLLLSEALKTPQDDNYHVPDARQSHLSECAFFFVAGTDHRSRCRSRYISLIWHIWCSMRDCKPLLAAFSCDYPSWAEGDGRPLSHFQVCRWCY